MQASNSCLSMQQKLFTRPALAWTGILPSLSSVCLHHLLRVFWHRIAAIEDNTQLTSRSHASWAMDEHTALLQQQQQLKKRHVQSGGSSPEQRLSDPPAPSHLGGVTASAAATASVPQQQHALSLEQQQQGSGKAQEHGLGSQRMLVPSDTAWRVLLAAPLTLWLVLTGLGIMLFRWVTWASRTWIVSMCSTDASAAKRGLCLHA